MGHSRAGTSNNALLNSSRGKKKKGLGNYATISRSWAGCIIRKVRGGVVLHPGKVNNKETSLWGVPRGQNYQ